MKTIELPEKITKNIYVTVGIGRYNTGDISVLDIKGVDDPCGDLGLVTILETQVEIDLSGADLSDANIKNIMISTLEKQKKDLMAKCNVEVNKIEDRIKNLLSIEYKSSQGE